MRKRRVLLLVILLLAIGFGAINTTLILTGVIGVGVKSEDWDVYFSYANITKNGTQAGSATISRDGKTVTFASDKLTTVGDTTILNYKVMNNSTQYDASVSISCEYETKDYLSVVAELNGKASPATDTINAQSEKSGKIRVELTKSVASDTSEPITCKLTVTPVEREDVVLPTRPIQLSSDVNGNGVADIGDMVTIGTERFYVYYNDSITIKALAEYNLEVGNSTNSDHPADEETNLQSPRAVTYWGNGVNKTYASIYFSSTRYWSSSGIIELNHPDNYIYPYLVRYKEILESYRANIQDVTLPTMSEIFDLGCNDDDYDMGYYCTSAPTWVGSLYYYTRSSPGTTLFTVNINSHHNGELYDDVSTNDDRYDYYGVRPVIVFSANEL